MQHWNQVELELVRQYVRGDLSSIEFSGDFIEARSKSINAGERQEKVTYLLNDVWYDIDAHLPDEWVGDSPETDQGLTREPGELTDEELRESLARRLRDWDASSYAAQYDA